MGTRVAILQSNYIPWRGYFDLIGSVDLFVLYDIVQFTKNDWRNRNRIKTAQGLTWLTIPVLTSGRFGQTIADTRIADRRWAIRHWRSLSQAYAKAPFFGTYRDRVAAAYDRCSSEEYLSAVNESFIRAIAAELGLSTTIRNAADFPIEGDRNERLVRMCRTAGASVYVSGPSGRNYLNLRLFEEAGIQVEYIDYAGYRPYPQVHGSFESYVSVLDLLFHVGPSAASYLSCCDRWPRAETASPPAANDEQRSSGGP